MIRNFFYGLIGYSIWIVAFTILSKGTDIYILSLEKNGYLEAEYSIHGLWPQYTNGSYPQYCKNVSFDENKITSLLPQLNKLWPSNMGPNKDFWKHEWEKHGSCVFTPMTEFEYFKKTLDLYNEAYKNGLIKNNCQNSECEFELNKNFQFLPTALERYDTIYQSDF